MYGKRELKHDLTVDVLNILWIVIFFWLVWWYCMKERRMSFGLRRDFWAHFLPHTLSSLFPPLCSLQHHSPSHFSPFISPEIVYYAPISLVSCLLSSSFLPMSLLCSVTSLPVVCSSLSFLYFSAFIPSSSSLYHYFIGILATALLSLPLSSSFLQRSRVCQFDMVVTLVYLKHKAKLWISTPVFIPLISETPLNSLLAAV